MDRTANGTATASSPRLDEKPDDETPDDNRQVLMVDDSKRDIRLVEYYLQNKTDLSADFQFCLSLDMAYQYIEGFHPDVLLLDYQFDHGATGFDVLKTLRQSTNLQVPVIILTAFNLEELSSRAFRLGAVEFLSKQDMTPGTLEFAIQNAFRDDRDAEENGSENHQRSRKKDSLTGLFNRNAMRGFLKREKDRNKKMTFAMIFIDVDDFQFLVQRHGHVLGNYILSRIGAILRSEVRPTDLAVRYGGDEFCVLQKVMDEKESMNLARRLVDRFDRDLTEGPSGDPINMSCSMGVSFLDADAPDENMIESLILSSDEALRNARFESGNSFFVDRL